jgi:hypothetical protein
MNGLAKRAAIVGLVGLAAVVFLLRVAADDAAPAPSPAPLIATSENRWAEPARDILQLQCGRCHLPHLSTSVPRALAVFDLTENPWYGRLTREQLDGLLHRALSGSAISEPDKAILEGFVRCARDHVCPAVPEEAGSR